MDGDGVRVGPPGPPERAGKYGDEVAPSWQGTQSDGGAPGPSWTDLPLRGSAPHVNPFFQGASGGSPGDPGRPEPLPPLPGGPPSLSAAIEETLARNGAMIRRVGWQHRLDEAGVDDHVAVVHELVNCRRQISDLRSA